MHSSSTLPTTSSSQPHIPFPSPELLNSTSQSKNTSIIPNSQSTDPTKLRKNDRQSFQYAWKSFVAGGIAGCAAKSVVAPLDRVKILFQAHSPHYVRHSGSFFGVFRAAKEIHESFGVAGLFQGHSATLLRIFPYAAIKFMSYEQYKAILMPTKADETPLRRLMSGSLAGITTVFFTYPLELIRVRLAFQVRSHQNFGISHTIRHIWNEPVIMPFTIPSFLQTRAAPLPSSIQCTLETTTTQPPTSSSTSYSSEPHPHQHQHRPIIRNNPLFSILNFYRGFFPTVWGMIPYAGVSFMIYEGLISSFKTNYADTTVNPETKKLYPTYTLIAGGVAGAVSQTVSYPFEVIRRRMQVSGSFTDITAFSSTSPSATSSSSSSTPLATSPNTAASCSQTSIHRDSTSTITKEQYERFRYRNTVQTALHIYRNHGFKGFFVGLSIGYLKVTPMSMASFWVYEICKRVLKIE